jgi:2-dehydro-3-deoxyphosphogluconate aldolase/(4S)-4-hydroxy-2-oxoglutarate aldolase
MTLNPVLSELGRAGLVPVIKIDRPQDAVPLAAALVGAGVPVMEITFRTAAARDAIQRIARDVPAVVLGAGTVLTLEQAQEAVDAGARYIVSPGYHAGIVDWCGARGIPVAPGVATATEIMSALDKGLQILKFFPAEELGGVRMLKALAGPFANVRFIPTGGITAGTLAEYVALPNVFAVGGSWMVAPRLIAAGDFSEIARLAVEARNIVRQVRQEGAAAP